MASGVNKFKIVSPPFSLIKSFFDEETSLHQGPQDLFEKNWFWCFRERYSMNCSLFSYKYTMKNSHKPFKVSPSRVNPLLEKKPSTSSFSFFFLCSSLELLFQKTNKQDEFDAQAPKDLPTLLGHPPKGSCWFFPIFVLLQHHPLWRLCRRRRSGWWEEREGEGKGGKGGRRVRGGCFGFLGVGVGRGVDNWEGG